MRCAASFHSRTRPCRSSSTIATGALSTSAVSRPSARPRLALLLERAVRLRVLDGDAGLGGVHLEQLQLLGPRTHAVGGQVDADDAEQAGAAGLQRSEQRVLGVPGPDLGGRREIRHPARHLLVPLDVAVVDEQAAHLLALRHPGVPHRARGALPEQRGAGVVVPRARDDLEAPSRITRWMAATPKPRPATRPRHTAASVRSRSRSSLIDRTSPCRRRSDAAHDSARSAVERGEGTFMASARRAPA